MEKDGNKEDEEIQGWEQNQDGASTECPRLEAIDITRPQFDVPVGKKFNLPSMVKGVGLASSVAALPSKYSEFMLESVKTPGNYKNSLPNLVMPRFDSDFSSFYAIQNLTQQISDSVSKMSMAIQPYTELINSINSIAKSFSELLKPNLDAITSIIDSFDKDNFWANYRDASERWGTLGWMIFDGMPRDVLHFTPANYVEANRIAKKYAKAELKQLRNELPGLVRRKADAAEMFLLFDKGYYKSCAMMACSLIDNEMYNWKISHLNTRRVTNTPKHLTTSNNAVNASMAAVYLVGIIAAHDYFFKSGNNFDRSVEGELNRNFLMHGMMYRKVTQVACMKLFFLLYKIVNLLPLCQLSQEGNGGHKTS